MDWVLGFILGPLTGLFSRTPRWKVNGFDLRVT